MTIVAIIVAALLLVSGSRTPVSDSRTLLVVPGGLLAALRLVSIALTDHGFLPMRCAWISTSPLRARDPPRSLDDQLVLYPLHT